MFRRIHSVHIIIKEKRRGIKLSAIFVVIIYVMLLHNVKFLKKLCGVYCFFEKKLYFCKLK